MRGWFELVSIRVSRFETVELGLRERARVEID